MASEPTRSCNASIIVPTYREAENLPVLVPQVVDVMLQAGITGEVVVVDDNSPDDTRTVCTELAADYPVRLFVREEERGLSSAVIYGMRHARGSVLVVMDADLSHPPDRIPALVRPVSEGEADLVIGSRYVSGGSTDEEWGILRRLNSRVATWLARPLTGVKDPMAGFFAIRREMVDAASDLNPVGYKIGLELIVKCRPRLLEVPIVFRERLHGQSKLSLREQVNYLRHLGRLYGYRIRRLFVE